MKLCMGTALALVALSIAAGAWGAVDWGLALTTACVAALAAKAAARVVRRRARSSPAEPPALLDFSARDRFYDRAA